ncbi:hypothetical protein P9112_009302 [Eukaryota sp. TZLM1-RC]
MSLDQLEHEISTFCSKLRRRQIIGAYHTSITALSLVQKYLKTIQFSDWNVLRKEFIIFGRRLTSAQPLELAIGNVIRRVLFLIRTFSKEQSTVRALSILSSTDPTDDVSPLTPRGLPRQIHETDYADFLVSVAELHEEITESYNDIRKQAKEHVHGKETIMVVGHSTTVYEFLTSVKDAICKVYVVERAPDYAGHRMALRLSNQGVSCTVVKDATTAALLPRVNKVIIGSHSVLADGGLLAPSGTGLIARLASHLSIPVICVCGTYKLSFLFVKDQHVKNMLLSPSMLVPLDSEVTLSDTTEVVNPLYEYVDPRNVDLYITNIGGHNPSEIYRLINQYYSNEDPIF